MDTEKQEPTQRYEGVLRDAEKQTYVLRLYVTGFTPASTRAITNLKALCEERLRGRFELEVIDIFQRPALARGEQIIATPTLVKLLPMPMQRFIGDLSGIGGKLFGLDVRARRERRT
ncbi:MAG TPA: circadian clock KaiB family protein [Bryobacteraceae bacterium]|jgi:circadian clock protein KaiB